MNKVLLIGGLGAVAAIGAWLYFRQSQAAPVLLQGFDPLTVDPTQAGKIAQAAVQKAQTYSPIATPVAPVDPVAVASTTTMDPVHVLAAVNQIVGTNVDTVDPVAVRQVVQQAVQQIQAQAAIAAQSPMISPRPSAAMLSLMPVATVTPSPAVSAAVSAAISPYRKALPMAGLR